MDDNIRKQVTQFSENLLYKVYVTTSQAEHFYSNLSCLFFLP